jgi:hypothetical protein
MFRTTSVVTSHVQSHPHVNQLWFYVCSLQMVIRRIYLTLLARSALESRTIYTYREDKGITNDKDVPWQSKWHYLDRLGSTTNPKRRIFYATISKWGCEFRCHLPPEHWWASSQFTEALHEGADRPLCRSSHVNGKRPCTCKKPEITARPRGTACGKSYTPDWDVSGYIRRSNRVGRDREHGNDQAAWK